MLHDPMAAIILLRLFVVDLARIEYAIIYSFYFKNKKNAL